MSDLCSWFSLAFLENEFTKFLAGFERGEDGAGVDGGVHSDLLRTLPADNELKTSGRVHTSHKPPARTATISTDLSRSGPDPVYQT